MSGTAVPPDFTFPWNAARTMADVWADERKTERAKIAKAAETARQLAYMAEYQSRKRTAATTMPAGRVAYAGYDGDEE
jgi:hypothetical protein